MPITPRVGIIIINYQGCADTLECLESVRSLTYPDFFVVLVCQPPDDGTVSTVRSLGCAGVHLIENADNNGFAGGNNAGIELAFAEGADIIFLLNNDTTVEPGLLEKLVAAIEPKEVGVVGPRMLYYDAPEIIWAMGGEMNALGHARHLQGKQHDSPLADPATKPLSVDYVIGCGLMVKRAVLEQVGLMDERYFLYYEESDLCSRIRRAGYQILAVPTARMWHKASRSTGDDSNLTAYYMLRNRLLYVQKQGNFVNLGKSVLDALRLLVVFRLKRKPKDRQQVLARAVGDFFCGKFGKADFPLNGAGT